MKINKKSHRLLRYTAFVILMFSVCFMANMTLNTNNNVSAEEVNTTDEYLDLTVENINTLGLANCIFEIDTTKRPQDYFIEDDVVMGFPFGISILYGLMGTPYLEFVGPTGYFLYQNGEWVNLTDTNKFILTGEDILAMGTEETPVCGIIHENLPLIMKLINPDYIAPTTTPITGGNTLTDIDNILDIKVVGGVSFGVIALAFLAFKILKGR